MVKILAVLTFAVATLFSSATFAGGKGHPVFTPLEPKANGGAFTQYLMSQPNFAKKSGFDAKTFQLVSQMKVSSKLLWRVLHATECSLTKFVLWLMIFVGSNN